VQLKNGRQIEARSVVLATGYVMQAIVQSTIHSVSSSWAIATNPQPQNTWKEGALIWEDSEDYLYARTTRAGRIIIGGEDSGEIIEPEARDGLIPEKSIILARRLAALWPPASLDLEFRWAGTFDNTSDGPAQRESTRRQRDHVQLTRRAVDRRPDRRLDLGAGGRSRAGSGGQIDRPLKDFVRRA
jgi:glycine/D-amino acid oxidase-like deaminating enzyme